jgi:flagellar basal-body rod protein FlgG
MITTDNALDVAIDGDGFFQVLMPDGNIGYTRNGTFSRNADGLMTTSSGYVLQPQITIPSGSSQINISQDGLVTALLAGEAGPQRIGPKSLWQGLPIRVD